ncbi:MAG: 4a-hydroxytetrahydrobiopterin dehydratase [Candidatus Hydrogenedentota bacterium]
MVLSVEALTESQIAEALQWLPEWAYEDKAISRVETFPTYLQALDFVQRVGRNAEEHNHHPDIIMNYKKVTVRYWTHKIGGVSKGDVLMAGKVESIVAEMKK